MGAGNKTGLWVLKVGSGLLTLSGLVFFLGCEQKLSRTELSKSPIQVIPTKAPKIDTPPMGEQTPTDGFAQLLVNPPAVVQLGIADKKDFTLQVKIPSGTSGSLDLVAKSHLGTLDPKSTISFAVTPAALQGAPGEIKDVVLHVESKADSPSFLETSGGEVAIELSSGGKLVGDGVLKVAVQPIMNVYVMGVDKFSSALGPLSKNNPLNFSKHKGTFTLRFINLDASTAQTVHGNGEIPHQDTSNPLAAAPKDGEEGGVYEVKVAEKNTKTTGNFYSHNGGGSPNNAIPCTFNN